MNRKKHLERVIRATCNCFRSSSLAEDGDRALEDEVRAFGDDDQAFKDNFVANTGDRIEEMTKLAKFDSCQRQLTVPARSLGERLDDENAAL